VDAPAEQSVVRAQTESEDLLRGRQLGDFVLRECIGEGGFATVYRCDQPLLGREAVVKVLHYRLRASEVVFQRFMREARLASRLDHPYAAHVYAFGVEPDGLAWIAMEFVHGMPLDRWLRERGPLPLDMLVSFFENVAEIVQNAHDHGIVHRDLKPSNVMMIEYAERVFPKLLDFGIAKLIDEAAQTQMPGVPIEATFDGPTAPVPTDSGNYQLTQANATLGSPPYMSPEQWCDPLSVGPRSDLYSLAVMAYEALTGRQPFTGSTIAEIGEQHCTAPVPPVGDQFPAALDRVFQRALAKDPDDRPTNALKFAKELRAAAFPPEGFELSGSIRPIVVAAPDPSQRPRNPKRKLWSMAAIAGALVASAVVTYTVRAQMADERAPVLPATPVARVEPAQPPPAPAGATAAAPTGPVPIAAAAPADTHATVVVEIESTPPGANVFRLPSETKVGSTPWKAELQREDGTQAYRVRKPGFEDRLVEIDLRTGGTHSVKLPRAVHRPPPPPTTTPPPPPTTTVPGRRKGEPVDPLGTPKTP
jgi:serine/threonine protein kinase